MESGQPSHWIKNRIITRLIVVVLVAVLVFGFYSYTQRREAALFDGFAHPIWDVRFVSDDILFCVDRKGTVFRAGRLSAPKAKIVAQTGRESWTFDGVSKTNDFAIGHSDETVELINSGK